MPSPPPKYAWKLKRVFLICWCLININCICSEEHLSQTLQWYGLSPVWMPQWILRWIQLSNILIRFLSTVDANMDIQNPLSWKLFIAHFDMVSLQYGCKDDHHYLKHIDMVSLHCGCEYGYSESSFLKTVHSSLWYGFSPVWMQRWPPWSQTYWYGFSPLWMRIWIFRIPFPENCS